MWGAIFALARNAFHLISDALGASCAEAISSNTDSPPAEPAMLALRTGMRMKRLIRTSLCLGFTTLLIGCMDGPFYQLKRINPYYLSTWKKDRQYGPTYEDRLKELHQVERRITKMSPTEQEEWANRLEEIVREDASPELRATAARIVAQMDSPVTDRALNVASTDEVEKVRLIACQAWQERGGTAARDMLLSMAQADESSSVRQAAIRSLAAFNEPEVLSALGNLLDDNSPAIVYNVAQSLSQMTGEKYGGDVESWKQYLNTTQPSPTVLEGGPGLPQVDNGEVRTVSGLNLPPLP